jgi:DNA-binding Lrp family transcriptional regulator
LADAGRLRELEHNGVITGYRAVLDLGTEQQSAGS